MRLSPRPHDAACAAYWPTPAWVTQALLDAHRISTAWVLEPSAGEGAIAEVLARQAYQVAAVELRAECDTALRRVLRPDSAHAVYAGCDFLGRRPDEWVPRDEPYAIVGNPPYDPAEAMLAHVGHAVCSGLTGRAQLVAQLLPTSFLHSRGRAAFNMERPPSAIYALARRPACREDCSAGGKRDLSWFVWDRRWPSNRQLIAVIP